MIELREAGGLTEIGSVELREEVVGDPTQIGEIWLRETGGLTLVWSLASDIILTVTPDVYGGASFPEPVGVTTSTATATVEGGIASFTYVWARTDGGAGTWQIPQQGQPTTTFRRLALDTGESASATFACTVTDSRGNFAVTDDVDATVTNF